MPPSKNIYMNAMFMQLWQSTHHNNMVFFPIFVIICLRHRRYVLLRAGNNYL